MANQPLTLADCRLALVQRRAVLRVAEAALALSRAAAEVTAIDEAYQEAVQRADGRPVDRAKVLGANEAERSRALLLALEDDAEYQSAVRAERELRTAVELLQAQIANAEDERDERKRLTRQDMVDLLAGRNLDDALADGLLDLAHPRRLAAHILTDREPRIPTFEESMREMSEDIRLADVAEQLD